MKKLLLAALVAVACLSQAQAQQVQPQNDSNKLYVTVFGESGEARFETVRGWFAGALASEVGKHHFNAFSTQHTMYKDRYASSIGELPCLRVQDASGKVLYQASGNNLPANAEAVKGILKTPQNCPWNKKPDTDPAPVEPDPDPVPAPDTVPTPDTAPEGGLPAWVYVLVAVAAGAAGGINKLKSQYAK